MGIFKKDPSAAADQNAAGTPVGDADRVAQLTAAVVGQVLRAPAVDEELLAAERAKYKRPKDGTRAFKVYARGGVTRKRRAGIEFTDEPKIVNAEDLTEAQAVELLNTPHLYVEELTSTSKDAVKPESASVAGPDPAQLRGAGDAPVPTPTNSPGRQGYAAGSQVIGGMSADEAPAPPKREPKPADKGEPK